MPLNDGTDLIGLRVQPPGLLPFFIDQQLVLGGLHEHKGAIHARISTHEREHLDRHITCLTSLHQPE